MLDMVRSIFGEYVPLSGEGIASVNWEYVASVLMFTIVLSGVLGIIRIMINKR